ncbi:nucleolar complex protein 3 homolog [Saccostrea echinata]|uniref:nucleolar complex protein 3 homolog n=1 Tax=Saccostrea echinata TaxID=191078 RepID=UPI002A7F503B|nr:nucleolar complex protein 3 homolog [Saccostrea echinata]
MAAKKSGKRGGKRKGYKASSVKLSNKRTSKLAKQGKLKPKKKKKGLAELNQQSERGDHIQVNGRGSLETEEESDLGEEDIEFYGTPGNASGFINAAKSRTLSTEVVKSGKKRKKKDTKEGDEEEQYEQRPRKLFANDENVKSLLPIKTKKGVVPQVTLVNPEVCEDEPAVKEEENNDPETSPAEKVEKLPALTNVELYANRQEKLRARKSRIAALASSLIENPEENIKKLKELRSYIMESDPDVFLTVRKLAMVSMMEVFKDIIPGYRIRLPTEAEKTQKLKKETKQIRDFEETFLLNYKKYLEFLEMTCKGKLVENKDKKYSRGGAELKLSSSASQTLSVLAVKCLCELLKTQPHFNYRNNIITVLIPLMNRGNREVSGIVCETVQEAFRGDKSGELSLEIIKCISRMVKAREFKVKKEVLDTFLSLKIKEVDYEGDSVKKDGKTRKEMMKKLSRRERKKKKKMELLEHELLETRASEDKNRKIKMHTEIIQTVFHTYFRVLKSLEKSSLLPSVLEGLAKFAHLINVDFFDDLFNVFNTLIDSGNLGYRESLHYIKTAFTILMGQGDVLNIDPMRFYTHLYNTMLKVNAGVSSDDASLVLECVECMLGRRKRQISQQRVLAFIKRICTLGLQQEGHSCLAMLAALRGFVVNYRSSELLYDNETQGSGVFLPELSHPEHSNAHNTMLWEITLMKHHYHPTVRQFATHLSKMAPTSGEGQLPVDLIRRDPKDFLKEYNPTEIFFGIKIPEKCSTKKKFSKSGSEFIQPEVGEIVTNVLQKMDSRSAKSDSSQDNNVT